MRVSRRFFVVLLAFGVVGCAAAPPRKGVDLAELGDSVDAAFTHNGRWDSPCALGVNLRFDGVILGLSDDALGAGLRQGDRVLSVDSAPFKDRIAYTASLRKKQLARGVTVTYSVSRGESVETVGVVCQDNTRAKELDRELVAALKRGDARECLEITSQQKGLVVPTAFLAYIDFTCRYYRTPMRDGGPRLGYAAYEMYGLELDEATKDPSQLDTVKVRVLGAIDLMRTAGMTAPADMLQNRLQEAERLTYETRVAEASSDDGGPPAAEPGIAAAFGTGFAVSPDGAILTSNHVVAGFASITVVLADGSRHPAKVLTASAQTDLIVLKVEAPTPAYLHLVSSSTAWQGEKLYTIGFPAPQLLGLAPKYSEGALSSTTGMEDDATFMQVSIPIQPGNSGGPVVDEHGGVVGVVAATAAVERFYAETGVMPQNVNWAVKSDYARLLLDGASIRPPLPKAEGRPSEAVRKAVCLIVAQ